MTELTPKTERRPSPPEAGQGTAQDTTTPPSPAAVDTKRGIGLPIFGGVLLLAVAGAVTAGWALVGKQRAEQAVGDATTALEASEARLTRALESTAASLAQSGLTLERSLGIRTVHDSRRRLVENALKVFVDVAEADPTAATPPNRSRVAYHQAAFASALLGQLDDAKAHLAKAMAATEDVVPSDEFTGRCELLVSAIAEAEDNGPARDEALSRAIAALDAEAGRDGATADTVHQCALAWVRLGTIRERSARLRAATEAYEKALSRTRTIDPELAATREVRTGSALASLRLGKLAVRKRQPETAGRFLDKAILHLRGLGAGDVADPTLATWLVDAHVANSEAAILQNRADLAATAARDAVESAERLLRSLQDDEATLSHARALLALGRAYGAQKDDENARMWLKRAESILENLCRLNPDSFDGNMTLSRAQLLLAQSVLSPADEAKAAVRYRAALERLDRIAVTSLDSSSHRELRGQLALAMGRYQAASTPVKAAEGPLAEAIGTFKALLKGWPAIAEYRRLLAEAYFARAAAWAAGERHSRAATSQREGIRTLQPLVDARPKDWRVQSEIALAHAKQASHHQRGGQLSKARESARLSITYFQKATKLAPRDDRLRRQLISAITLNARIMLALGDHHGVSREMDALLRAHPDQQLTVASYFSAAIPVVMADQQINRGNRDRLATKYGDIAIRILRDLFDADQLSMEKLDSMQDLLAPIRERQAYRRLVADVVLMATKAAEKKSK